MAQAAYVPPPDPDFEALATEGYRQWLADRPWTVAFDTETTGLAFYDTAFCVTVAWRSRSGEITGHYFELERFDSAPYLREMLNGRLPTDHPTLVGHNLKFDLQKAVLAGLIDRRELYAGRLHDTEALAHLENEHRTKGLKDLMVSVLGWNDVVEVEIKSGENKGMIKLVPREKAELDFVRRKLKLTKDDGWHLLPRAVVVPYAITDATATLALYEKLRPRVELHPDLWELYLQEQELSLVLLDMETQGMRLDLPYVGEQIREYTKKVIQIDTDMAAVVGKPVRTGKMTAKEKPLYFNPASSEQIKRFFTEAGHERPNYDKDQLPTIDHPLARLLLQRRKVTKILDTYFTAMKDEQKDGILHPNFRQHGTVTGRMSSGKQEG